jgi:hypothetical protein
MIGILDFVSNAFATWAMPMLPPVRERIAELMPTSLPFRFTSAPPELPGLIDASVWMKSS